MKKIIKNCLILLFFMLINFNVLYAAKKLPLKTYYTYLEKYQTTKIRNARQIDRVAKIQTDLRNLVLEYYNDKEYDTALEVLTRFKPVFFKNYEVSMFCAIYYIKRDYQKIVDIVKEYGVDKIKDDKKSVNKINEKIRSFYNKADAELRDINTRKKLEKFRELFNKAETLFLYKKYDESKKLYEQALSLISEGKLYEIKESKSKLKKIADIKLMEAIEKLKENVLSESKFSKQLELIDVFYGSYYEKATDISKKELSNIFLTLLEKQNVEEIDRLIKINKPVFNLEKKGILEILVNKSIEKNDLSSIKKYLNEFLNIYGDKDKKYLDLSSKYNSIKLWFYIKIVLYILIAGMVAIVVVYRNKIFIFYLKIKMKYYENIDERFKLKNIYEYFYNLNPEDNEIKIKLWELYFDIKEEPEKIVKIFCEIKKSWHLKYELIMETMDLLLKSKEIEKFLDITNRLTHKYKEEPKKQLEIFMKQYEYYTKRKDIDAAIEICNKVLELNFDRRIVKNLCELYAEKGDFGKVYLFLRDWLRKESYDAEKIMEITNNIIQNYNYQGYKLYDFFGLLCRMLKERDLGIEVYEYLETQHQNNLPNYTYLYDFYFMKNDIINLVRVLEKIIELRPFVLEDKLNLATYYFQLKRYEDSIEQLKIVLKNDNKSLKAVELLNEIAEQYSDKSKSVELYNFILKNSLYENHEIRLILGKLLINQGSFDEAIKVLQKINSGDPALVCEAKLEIVNALKKMKSYKIALELLESLDSESDSYTGEQKIHILYNKAYCYEKINKLEEAKKLYQRVIMIDINFLDSKERYNKLLN